jgi:hypothetical protein
MCFLQDQKSFLISAYREQDLDAWIDIIREKAGSGSFHHPCHAQAVLLGGPSAPQNVTHRVHVTFDAQSASFL